MAWPSGSRPPAPTPMASTVIAGCGPQSVGQRGQQRGAGRRAQLGAARAGVRRDAAQQLDDRRAAAPAARRARCGPCRTRPPPARRRPRPGPRCTKPAQTPTTSAIASSAPTSWKCTSSRDVPCTAPSAAASRSNVGVRQAADGLVQRGRVEQRRGRRARCRCVDGVGDLDVAAGGGEAGRGDVLGRERDRPRARPRRPPARAPRAARRRRAGRRAACRRWHPTRRRPSRSRRRRSVAVRRCGPPGPRTRRRRSRCRCSRRVTPGAQELSIAEQRGQRRRTRRRTRRWSAPRPAGRRPGRRPRSAARPPCRRPRPGSRPPRAGRGPRAAGAGPATPTSSMRRPRRRAPGAVSAASAATGASEVPARPPPARARARSAAARAWRRARPGRATASGELRRRRSVDGLVGEPGGEHRPVGVRLVQVRRISTTCAGVLPAP